MISGKVSPKTLIAFLAASVFPAPDVKSINPRFNSGSLIVVANCIIASAPVSLVSLRTSMLAEKRLSVSISLRCFIKSSLLKPVTFCNASSSMAYLAVPFASCSVDMFTPRPNLSSCCKKPADAVPISSAVIPNLRRSIPALAKGPSSLVNIPTALVNLVAPPPTVCPH